MRHGWDLGTRPDGDDRDRFAAVTATTDTLPLEATRDVPLDHLERWISAPVGSLLAPVRERDALLGREVRWAGGRGVRAGIDEGGRLVVETESGWIALDAGEVHLPGCAGGVHFSQKRSPASPRLHISASQALMLQSPSRRGEFRAFCTPS